MQRNDAFLHDGDKNIAEYRWSSTASFLNLFVLLQYGSKEIVNLTDYHFTKK